MNQAMADLAGVFHQSKPRTLVFLPIGLGNFLMATPCLKLLSRHIGSNLHLLALKPGIAQMAKASGWFGRVSNWDPDSDNLLSGFRTLRELRRERYGVSLSLFPTAHWKFATFARMVRARRRAGFFYTSSFLPTLVQHYSHPRAEVHDVEQNFAFVRSLLGNEVVPPGPMEFPMELSPALEGQLTDKKYFVCHPGSSAEREMALKRWAPDKFAEIISRIYSTFKIPCLLVGGPEEVSLRREVASGCPKESLLNIFTENIQEVATTIRHSRFFLGNDSGLMHLAVSLTRPCIALFGPSDENRTGPYPSREHLVLRHSEVELLGRGSVRLKYRGDGGLGKLTARLAWNKVEPYLGKLLELK